MQRVFEFKMLGGLLPGFNHMFEDTQCEVIGDLDMGHPEMYLPFRTDLRPGPYLRFNLLSAIPKAFSMICAKHIG